MKTPRKRTDRDEREDRIRVRAFEIAREHIDEAIAILAGPLDEAAAKRERLKTAADPSLPADHPAITGFCRADANHARLESLVAVLRDARDRTNEGGR